MSDRRFVDTNILIYAHDLDAGIRHRRAAALVKELWEAGDGVLSIQVLQEFYVNVTRKIGRPLDPATARDILELYGHWEVVVPDVAMVLRASEIQQRVGLSFWDAMIVAAALGAGASLLITEDLNHGQQIEGIRVHNPFLAGGCGAE